METLGLLRQLDVSGRRTAMADDSIWVTDSNRKPWPTPEMNQLER